jgi:AcrR family transcriptional regulator
MPNTASKARERILETASTLFYQKGIRNVGIDEIIATSGVARMTLYKHFTSKDQLVVEVLRHRCERWLSWFRETVERSSPTAQAKLLAIFDALDEWFKQPEFRGCPFINAVAELADSTHPGHQVAIEFRQAVRFYIVQLAQEIDIADAETFTEQFMLVFGGAIVMASIEGSANAAHFARQAALILLHSLGIETT